MPPTHHLCTSPLNWTSISNCMFNILTWMSNEHLKITSSKTKSLIFFSRIVFPSTQMENPFYLNIAFPLYFLQQDYICWKVSYYIPYVLTSRSSIGKLALQQKKSVFTSVFLSLYSDLPFNLQILPLAKSCYSSLPF